mgnify:CR=1 FL=1
MAKGEKVAAGDPRDLNKNGRVSKKEQAKFNKTADAGNAGPLAGYNLTLLGSTAMPWRSWRST